jgi:C1A family cysteine protease/fibronectin type 3 domain-containing protein
MGGFSNLHAVRWCALGVLMLVFAAGCGGSKGPGGTGSVTPGSGQRSGATTPVPSGRVPVVMAPQASAQPPFATAALSSPQTVAGASGAGPTSIAGSGFVADRGTNGAVASDGYAVLSPGSSPAYCAFTLAFGADELKDGRQTIGFTWDSERLPDYRQLWVGLSDGSANWTWFAGPADDVLTVESLASYAGADGSGVVLLVLAGGPLAALERLTLGQSEMRGTGCLPEPQPLESKSISRRTSDTLPPDADISAGMPAVHDQGQVGSCTAFAVGDAAFNYELGVLYSGDGWDFHDSFNLVSPRYLYVGSGETEGGEPNYGCPDDGRYLSGVLDYVLDYGVASNQNAPYEDICDNDWTQDALDDAALLKCTDWEYIECGNAACIDAIKTVLAEDSRPVVISLNLDSAFQSYNGTGVWQYTGPSIGGHAVCLVGYDDALDAFKARNSWSSDWGDDGSIWIGYDSLNGTNGTENLSAFYLTATYDGDVATRFCNAPSSLGAPTGVAATTNHNDYIHVTWNSVSGATGYKLYRAKFSELGSYELLATQAGTSYDEYPTEFGFFWYKVQAYNASETSAYSDGAYGYAQLAAPPDFEASQGTYSDHVHVSWTDDMRPWMDSYKLYRSTTETGTYSLIGTIDSADPLEYDDTPPDTSTYWYKIKAHHDIAGDGPYSAAVPGYYGIPEVPANVEATDGSLLDRVRLTWDACAGATSYKVYRSTSENGTYSQIGAPTTNTMDMITGVTTTYWFKVTAWNAQGESAFSDADSGNAGMAAPTGVSATDGTITDRVRITWNAVSGADFYQVYRSTSVAGTYSLVGSPTATQYDDIQSTTTTYYYKVRAGVTAVGYSTTSSANSGYAGLATPTNFVATDGTVTDRVHLSWNSVSGALDYRIYRATSANGTYSLLTYTTGTSCDDLLPVTTVYYYKIRARNASGYSNTSAAEAGNAGLAMPTNFAATDGTYTSYVRLSWTAVSNVLDYRIYRATSANGTYALVVTTTATAYNFTESTDDVYYYKIRARNASGYSQTSAAEAGNAGLNAPTNMGASDGNYNDRIRVYWDAAPGAGYYQVYRSTSANGTYTLAGNTAATHFDDFVGDTATYYYKVRSGVTNVGYSAFVGPDSGYKAP